MVSLPELINLKWEDIDRSRMLIYVKNAKGKKDRQLPLNDVLIKVLTDYYREYKSKVYVFNGQDDRLKYCDRSVNNVLKQLAEKAGIKKRIYPHLIRHTAMSHNVENGIDIEIIRRLAGHKSQKTTALYIHLSNRHLSNISTPICKIRI
jgi:site-specific recombinase XerD